MKKTIYMLVVICSILFACTTMKKRPQSNTGIQQLNGTWELTYISGPRIAFDGLYHDKKPVLTFDIKEKRVFGNTSCNSFSAPLVAEGTKLDFTGPMVMTKMYCPGAGESTFLETLKKVNTYAVSGDSILNLIMGDIAVMRFTKLPGKM